MAIKPLADRVLVELKQENEEKIGSIYVPDTAKEKPQEGKIVAAGEGRTLDDGKVLPLTVKPGQTVLFGKFSGTEVVQDGKPYLIIREMDILGIIE